jgi:hypothetical protein
MKQISFLFTRVFLVGFLAQVFTAEPAECAGSPDTRLIAIGFNFLTDGPFTPGHLFEIDKQMGGLTPIGTGFNMELDQIGPNLAANSLGQLFNAFSVFANARINRLTITGEVARFVPLSDGTSFPPFVYAIGFNAQDQLYGMLLNGSPVIDAPPTLSTIDTSTGLASTVALLDSLGFTSMAFDSQNTLYAVAETVGLVRIDVDSGESTVIGGDLMNRPPTDLGRRPIVFDRDGTMFAAAERLLVVDPTTGSTTPVGTSTFGFPYSIVGLAIVAVPEPGTLGMIGFAALVLCLMPANLIKARYRTSFRKV